MLSADELLNGGFAQPMWSSVNPKAATAPSEVGTSTSTAPANAKAVVVAWLARFALLVIANVLTLSVQR